MIRANNVPLPSGISAMASTPDGATLRAARMPVSDRKAAAASWASISVRLNAGLATLSTPTGAPEARSRKLASCWLPSGSAVTSRPKCRRAMDAASSTERIGAGSSPAWKKSNRVIVPRLRERWIPRLHCTSPCGYGG